LAPCSAGEINGKSNRTFVPLPGSLSRWTSPPSRLDDLVFVLDVNSDYQPWLIERKRLFAAVDTLDGDKKRGLILIE